MLVGKSQGFDLQEFRLGQQTIDVNAQRMSSQLAVQAGTQAPEGMGVILLDAQLPRQLAVHCLNQLAEGIMQMSKRLRNLLHLIGARDGSQTDAVLLPQLSGFGGTDIAFVSQHIQVGMLTEQLKPGFQIRAVGRGQFKVQDQAAQTDQQVQAIAKNGLFFLVVTFPKAAP